MVTEYFGYEELDLEEMLISLKEQINDEEDATKVQNFIDSFHS